MLSIIHFYKVADSEETANEYFEDKLNNALKVIEQISDKLQIIFTMLSKLSLNENSLIMTSVKS